MRNVLITGGTGFVGKWMQRTQPDGITGHYLSKANYNDEDLRIWWGVDYIVHLAPILPDRVMSLKFGESDVLRF